MDTTTLSNISRVRQINPNQHLRGVKNEIIKIENAKLWFIGGCENNRLVGIVKEGDFQIHMIIQSLTPTLLMKCIVDSLEWPLTRDSLVMRVGIWSFAFVMPGLIYGLQFSPNTHEIILEMLERIFMRFGLYEDYSGKKTGLSLFGSDLHPHFWPISQCTIDYISQPLLKELGTYWQRDEFLKDNMNDRVLRVQHMSFVVNLISKVLLIGTMDPTKHIAVTEKCWATNHDGGDEIKLHASPTIFLFSDLVEAFEKSKGIHNPIITPYDPRWTPILNTTFWNINTNGLLMILPVVKGALGMNFEVKVKVYHGEDHHNFFVPLKTNSNENMKEERVAPREIRFSIMDDVGLIHKNKIAYEQLGMEWNNLEL